jgi:tetratricopeptide (TPR) repeat protein
MQRRLIGTWLVVALAGVSLAGCGQYKMLKARKAFKEANVLYQQQDYRRAAIRYEEVVEDQGVVDANATLTPAYFFLANSYDNQFKPSRKGEAENDKFLEKAVEYYKKSAQVETDKTLKTRSMQYLVAAYGPDKLNQPEQAEPLLLEMIKIDPTEPSNYQFLSRMYEDNGDYEKAEEILVQAKDARPNDPMVYRQLAGFYNRQGEFEKTMQALDERAAKEPTNPEAYYEMAMYYWEKGYRDYSLKDADKISYIKRGLEASDKALGLKSDYAEALTAKNLLLRAQALAEKDPGVQQRLIKEADQIRDRAIELRKRAAGNNPTEPTK